MSTFVNVILSVDIKRDESKNKYIFSIFKDEYSDSGNSSLSNNSSVQDFKQQNQVNPHPQPSFQCVPLSFLIIDNLIPG